MKKSATFLVTLFLIVMFCFAAAAAEMPTAQNELQHMTISKCRVVTIGDEKHCTCGVICMEDDVEIAIFKIDENCGQGKAFLTRDIERIRMDYPAGTKVRMIHSEEKAAPIAGTVGEVLKADSSGMLRVAWEDGSDMPLVPGIDSFDKIK